MCRRWPYLPGSQTRGAHQVSAGLNLHIFVVLCADLTELEGGAHLAVELVLLLHGETRRTRRRRVNTSCSRYSAWLYSTCAGERRAPNRPNLSNFDVVLWRRLTQPGQVWVLCATIWEKVAGDPPHTEAQTRVRNKQK